MSNGRPFGNSRATLPDVGFVLLAVFETGAPDLRSFPMANRLGQRFARSDRLRIGLAPHANYLGRLADVSGSGAFVVTSLSAPLLVKIRVVFNLSSERWIERITLNAHAVRSTRSGLGIEWDDYCPHLIAKLLDSKPQAPWDFRRWPGERQFSLLRPSFAPLATASPRTPEQSFAPIDLSTLPTLEH